MDDDLVARVIDELLAARRPGASVCPSEVARALTPDDWRPLMPVVRRVAVTLAMRGRLRILQRGHPVDPRQLPPGPLRLAHPAGPVAG